jgi:hypothetical protein
MDFGSFVSGLFCFWVERKISAMLCNKNNQNSPTHELITRDRICAVKRAMHGASRLKAFAFERRALLLGILTTKDFEAFYTSAFFTAFQAVKVRAFFVLRIKRNMDFSSKESQDLIAHKQITYDMISARFNRAIFHLAQLTTETREPREWPSFGRDPFRPPFASGN